MVKSTYNQPASMAERSFEVSAINDASMNLDTMDMVPLNSQATGNPNNGPASSGQIHVLHAMQKSNLGDERISLGSLNEAE